MSESIHTFPERIVLELTPLCNLSCDMCPRHIIDKHNGYMSRELWVKLVDEIIDNNPKNIILPFWRGESLLHKNFIDLSEYALNKKARLHISTNAELLKETTSLVLAKYEFITFSVHTIKGYEKAVEFVKKHKTASNTIQASFVDCEADMMHYLDQLIADDSLFGFDAIRLYQEHTKEGKFGYSGKEFLETRVFCPKLENTFVVAFDGTISRCNHIWNTEDYNLTTTSIKEAWNSHKMNEIRINYPDALCLPCDQWTGATNGKSWRKEDHTILERTIGSN